MPAAIGALASAGAGLYASYQQGQAQKRALNLNRRQQAAAFAFLQKERLRDELMGKLGQNQLLAGHKAELAGFRGAQTGIDLGALQARGAAQAQNKVNLAGAEQSAVSRGLLGTSVGMQGIQGVGDQTSAQLAAIEQGHAAQLAELGLQKSGLQGQQARELTGYMGQQQNIQRDYGYELASLAPAIPRGRKKKSWRKKGWGRIGADLATLGVNEYV